MPGSVFHPYVHGWRFNNRFALSVDDVGVASTWVITSGVGLGPGMVTRALELYNSGTAPSRQTDPPGRGSALYSTLLNRQTTFLSKNSLLQKFTDMDTRPDQPGTLKPHTTGFKSKQQWATKIKPRLDGAKAVPIGVVLLGGNWRVYLACGYQEDSDGRVSIRLYNPDYADLPRLPNQQSGGYVDLHTTLSFSLTAANNQIAAMVRVAPASGSTAGESWARGFFALDWPAVKVGNLGTLRIDDLRFKGMEVDAHSAGARRRDRVELRVGLSPNVMPYFNVMTSYDGPPGMEERYVDPLTGEGMGPHACDAVQTQHTLELNVLHGYWFERERVHVAVEVLGQRQDAVVQLPVPRLGVGRFLHTWHHGSGFGLGYSHIRDGEPNDVVVVERDISAVTVAELWPRAVVVNCPAEGWDVAAPSILVGWRREFHLGYIQVPVYCRLWTESMLPPVYTMVQEVPSGAHGEIPEAERERYLLINRFHQSDYAADRAREFSFTARDAAWMHAYVRELFYAKSLLNFVTPQYKALLDWIRWADIRERIVEYIDREMLKGFIVGLRGAEQRWMATHSDRYRQAVLHEARNALPEVLALPAADAELRRLGELCARLAAVRAPDRKELAERAGEQKATYRDLDPHLAREYADVVAATLGRLLGERMTQQRVFEHTLKRLMRRGA